MLRLLLDEGLSPSISAWLWNDGVDKYPLRDRGLLGLADHEVWALANAQGRAVVTINGADFRRAKRGGDHAGLMIIPSGGTRRDHLRLVRLGLEHARSGGAEVSLRNRIVEVLPDGEFRIETTSPSQSR